MKSPLKIIAQSNGKLLFLMLLILITPLFLNFGSSALNDGLVSYYKLDETSGTTAEDIAGTNDGTTTGATVNQVGKLETAYSFDGINDYVQIDSLALALNKTTQGSIQTWIYPTNLSGGQQNFIMFGGSTGNTQLLMDTETNGSIRAYVVYDGTSKWIIQSTTAPLVNNNWYHVILTFDGTIPTLYVNGANTSYSYLNTGNTSAWFDNGNYNKGRLGVANNSASTWGYYQGKIDEVGIWNRSLSASEVSSLYNSGAGSRPIASTEATITLETPVNDSQLSDTTLTFVASGTNLSTSNWQWKNITWYVYNTTGTFNSTFVNIVDAVTFNETINISGFTTGNYQWNVYGCYGNVSYNNCTFATQNNTFDWRPFEILSQGYDNFVYETDYKRFNLSIETLPTVLTVTSKLNYNSVLYNANTSCSAGTCTIFSNIDIPLVSSGESVNYSFYWEIDVFDGTDSYEFDTTDETLSQNVTRIHLEKCDGTYTTRTLNFSAWNEKNLTRITPFSISGTFNTWLGSGAVTRNQSFTNTSTSYLDLCLTPTHKTQFTDAQIEYSFNDENTTYVPRNYFFQNGSLTNSTQNVSLYLLEAEDSTTFIIKVQDQKLSPVVNALIYIQRYYPSDGTYRTVQIAKTDSNGETIGFYEVETVDYKHIIVKDGEILLETTQQKVVGKDVPYTLTFTVGSALGYPWEPFQKNPNIYSSLTYNKTSKIVTFTYIDTTGTITNGRLTVLELSNTNSTKTVICNTSSSQTSATITCNMTEYEGSFYAYGYLEYEVTDVLNFLISTARDVFGKEGLLIGMFIIMVAGFAFIWNPTAGVIAINAAVIFTNMIGFISLSPVFIFGLIGVSFFAIILLKT